MYKIVVSVLCNNVILKQLRST
uniref:Uncharacterized protein n=1 Tax=Rhizophora mucronata TaxID=61149 RepID=A0A2P2N440_RHIMU